MKTNLIAVAFLTGLGVLSQAAGFQPAARLEKALRKPIFGKTVKQPVPLLAPGSSGVLG